MSNADTHFSSNAPLSISPLAWWRNLCAPAFTPEHATALRQRLVRAKIPGAHRFRDASRGDAAAAIGIALRLLRDPEVNPDRLDVALSAVQLCALNGDWAARDVLVLALRRSGDPASALIAESWRRAPAIEADDAPHASGQRRRRRVAHRANWARRQPCRMRPAR